MIWSSELGVSTRHRLGRDAGRARRFSWRTMSSMNCLEVRIERRTSGRSVSRSWPIRSGSSRNHSVAGKTIAATAILAMARNSTTQRKAASAGGHAPPLQPFQRRHQGDRDHQGGGDRQEEFGAGAQARRAKRAAGRRRRSGPARRAAGRGDRRSPRSRARQSRSPDSARAAWADRRPSSARPAHASHPAPAA